MFTGGHAGIPVSTKLMKAAAGYDLYKGVQMPYGAGSADFACTNSATSKNICELAGDVTVSLMCTCRCHPDTASVQSHVCASSACSERHIVSWMLLPDTRDEDQQCHWLAI